MRKSHKQEMLALLGTMSKMADLLPKMANPAEQIQDLLGASECLRDNLELENAPESLDLLQTVETSLKENKLDILEYIKNLELTFNSEVKTKLEVLFLPYKASMWDSLESIYFAAKDDPACDAFVMPIPYYDMKNGKFTEMHWETNYPKNISLIDYRKYNIEERHPDMIFIHNPYDGYNIVTSVHPDFYSKKLRNLTDCLVYVPYFVGNGVNIQEHFCTLPGCIFAHKVIVQTEKEREIYVRVYKEFAKKNGTPERFDRIGDKFLALGSPKLDKAANTKSENCEIPEEWKKLIGTKKVVFYNTTIAALLENSVEDNKPSNKYLQKVRSVFEFFKKREDAVLLWRPHPLLEGTIKSMRPWLEQEYAEIVREYKSEGYGIYDDTEDLNRSIAISDVYYGDGSSVMKLFDTARKPVVWQDVTAENIIEPSLLRYISNYEIPEEWEKLIKNADGTRRKVVFYNASVSALLESSMAVKKNNAVLLWRPRFEQEYAEIAKEYKTGNYGIYDDTEHLNRAVAVSDVYYGDGSDVTALFYDAKKTVSVSRIPAFVGIYDDGVSVWFMDDSNALYKYDKQSKKTEYMGMITLQNNWGNARVTVNNKKLYFAPFYKNDKISVFDMDKKCFEQISFKDDCKYDRKFRNVICFKNFIYFIPQEFPAIMRLNTNTEEIKYFSEWLSDVSKLPISKLQEGWENIIFLESCITDEEIAIVIKGINAVMFFNIETGNYEIKSIGEKSEQYHGICFDGQNYYLSLLYEDYIVKWNRQSNKTSKIKIPSFSRREGIGAIFLIRYLNEYVWLFPSYANNAYKININTDEITELPKLVEHFGDKNLVWYYNIIFANGDSIYAATLNKGIVEYNTNTSELNFIRLAVEESQLVGLLNNNKTSDKNAGKRIWEHLKGGEP